MKEQPPPTDHVARLIDDARAGGQAAVEELCLHFEPGLRTYVQHKMGPRARRWDEPQDLVQETLSEILGKPETLPAQLDESQLRARLYRTASNRILDHVRRHERQAGSSAIPPGKAEPACGTHSVTRRDQRDLLQELVERLPDSHREIVRLCALEELSFVDAAERLGMHPDTVRKRYDKARSTLESKLRERRHGS